MLQLTKAEEQLMRILWELPQATVQQVLEKFTSTKPARTTVATILSILENKGFVERTSQGKANVYRPTVSKNAYSKSQLSGILSNYFNNSFASMASFFAKENNISLEALDLLLEETREELRNENQNQSL
ncbi:MAG: BlaI/MecI/CopY family transcriptional regulator [Prevotellaceae bacterium]|jgi:predicted transcriptional regulator|nr:BlaI/MecI/CopY family transcriptional regulator [Prevotellaceae bacterium]